MSTPGSSLRRTTPETLKAQQYAKSYQQPGAGRVTRAAALKVAKLAAAAMGLKSSKIAMIDQLFACSKANDWTADGVSPVVWPSNARLARSLGISISTMKHHLNGLVKAGLVAYSDGPTYQRRGRRDDDGNIVEACGIDLSPIAVRFKELTELVEAAEYAAREWKRFSYRRTVVRKEIQSLILSAQEQELVGPWDHAQARLDVLLELRPTELEEIRDQVAALEALQDELQDIYDDVIQDLNFNAAVSKFRPIQTTTQSSNSESSNQIRSCASAQHSNPKTASGSMAFEKKPNGEFSDDQRHSTPRNTVEDDKQYLSLSLVKDACPSLEAFAPGSLENWYTLRSRGRDLCTAAGINPQVWQEASDVLGPDVAVAAAAVTVQKAEMGLVAKPGAYLRTLTQRGRAGELYISRSLFALAKGEGASPASAGASAPKPTEAIAFPGSGSISYSRWGDLVRKHGPKPTPDVDSVANAFRSWTNRQNIDTSSPDIERIFIGFCKKWRMN